ncbi:MAG: hypothetical protein WEE89_15070 [Gemmatimonadota bacterium]
MSEYRDLSRLPEDQAYWDDLESRVMAGLQDEIIPAEPAGLWAPLAGRALALGGLAAAAALAALLLVPARTTQQVMTAGLLRLPENDPMVAAFVSAAAPPSLTTLMFSGESPR